MVFLSFLCIPGPGKYGFLRSVALSTFALKFTVYNIFLCFNFSQYIYNQISIFCCVNTIKTFSVLYSGYCLHLLLLQHGDIESKPGPTKEQIKCISRCHWHWNVSSLLAQNMCKISQIEVYSSLYNYDFICKYQKYTLILQY